MSKGEQQNTEQQALLNEVSQKQRNEIELSFEETKQHKDTKYKRNIQSCSRSLNEGVLEKDFVFFSDDSESDIEILSSSIIQIFENGASEITHAAATTSMANIEVVQNNIVERKEEKKSTTVDAWNNGCSI